MFARRNVSCCNAVTVPAVRIDNACSWSPHCISVLPCSGFTTCVPCMLLLLRTFRSPMTKLFALVARNFCFARSAPLFMDLLDFTFIEFDFFLSFSRVTSAVASADANLSARNSIAQSFSVSRFTVCVLVGMVSQTSLKLSYSLPSVDKICLVSIRSDSVFSLCFTNSSFRSTYSFCSLATCVLSPPCRHVVPGRKTQLAY